MCNRSLFKGWDRELPKAYNDLLLACKGNLIQSPVHEHGNCGHAYHQLETAPKEDDLVATCNTKDILNLITPLVVVAI
jgi:hypothetical protein